MSVSNSGTVFPDPSTFPGDAIIEKDLTVEEDSLFNGDVNIMGTLNAGAIVVTGVDVPIVKTDTVQSHTTKDLRLETLDSGAGITLASATGIATVDTEILVDDIKEKTTAAGVTIEAVLLKDGQINTGEGLTEVFPMDQPLTAASNVVFEQMKINTILEKTLMNGVDLEGVNFRAGVAEFAAGTVADPSIKIVDPGTGFYSQGLNNISITAGGALVGSWTPAGLTSSPSLFAPSLGLKTDFINEFTVGAGVTAEGVLLKDSQILAGSGAGSPGVSDISFNNNPTTGFSEQSLFTFFSLFLNAGGGTPLTLSYDTGSGDGSSIFDTKTNTFNSGSAAAPVITFAGDTDTGIHHPGADEVAISTGGTSRLTVGSTAIESTVPIRTATGLASAPAYSFTGETNSGMYDAGVFTLGFSTNSAVRLLLSDTRATLNLPLSVPVGTAAIPGYSFNGDENTGLYNSDADEISVTTGGVRRVTFEDTQIESTVPIRTLDGTSAAPAYSYAGATNTGTYRSGGGEVSTTVAGTRIFTVASTYVECKKQVRGDPAAGFAAPAYAFSGDEDTGVYNHAPNNLGISAGGSVVSIFSTGLFNNLNNMSNGGQIRNSQGTAVNPSYAFSTDLGTGMYQPAVDRVAFSADGQQKLECSTTNIIVGTGATNYSLPITRGTVDQILKTNGSGVVTWSTVPAVETITISNTTLSASSNTPTDVAFVVWDNTRFSTFNSGRCSFWYITSADRDLTVAIHDGTSNIGSLSVPQGTATGLQTFTITNPGGNVRLALRISKDANGGTDPKLSGTQLIF